MDEGLRTGLRKHSNANTKTLAGVLIPTPQPLFKYHSEGLLPSAF